MQTLIALLVHVFHWYYMEWIPLSMYSLMNLYYNYYIKTVQIGNATLRLSSFTSYLRAVERVAIESFTSCL